MIRIRHVSLIEGRFPHITMRVVPIAVADRLKATVWDRTATVIAVSATRQTGGSFECWMGRVGAPRDTATMAMPSPCNFRARARLYVPRPPEAFVPVAPTQQAYGRDTEAMVGAMIGLLHARQARALVLCTSARAMQVWGERVAPAISYRTLVQGDDPRQVLLDIFREDVDSGLFATRSFWQGIDVSGESLS
jgi:ATP-dependent DNA helicase DinG